MVKDVLLLTGYYRTYQSLIAIPPSTYCVGTTGAPLCYNNNQIAGSSNGRTLGFGPSNWGSNPYPARLFPNLQLRMLNKST